jgi:hypothetical protein
MRTMIDAFAEFERALIRSRTKAALDARRTRGQRYSRFAPFGWRYEEDGRMVPVPAEQETLKRVMVLRKRGLTFRAIGDRLTKEGRHPSRALLWAAPVVRALVLRSR